MLVFVGACCIAALFGAYVKMSTEEMDPKRREEETATKVTIGGGSGGITKSEMMSEMRIMI